MSKKLCKLVSDGILKDDLKAYKKLVNKPKYVCKKCGRVANDEDSLCKPKKMKAGKKISVKQEDGILEEQEVLVEVGVAVDEETINSNVLPMEMNNPDEMDDGEILYDSEEDLNMED